MSSGSLGRRLLSLWAALKHRRPQSQPHQSDTSSNKATPVCLTAVLPRRVHRSRQSLVPAASTSHSFPEAAVNSTLAPLNSDTAKSIIYTESAPIPEETTKPEVPHLNTKDFKELRFQDKSRNPESEVRKEVRSYLKT